MTSFHQVTPTEATHVTTLDLINQVEWQTVTKRTLPRTGHRRMQPAAGRVKAGLLTGRQAAVGRQSVSQRVLGDDSDQRTQHSDVTQVPHDTTRELDPYVRVRADRGCPSSSRNTPPSYPQIHHHRFFWSHHDNPHTF